MLGSHPAWRPSASERRPREQAKNYTRFADGSASTRIDRWCVGASTHLPRRPPCRAAREAMSLDTRALNQLTSNDENQPPVYLAIELASELRCAQRAQTLSPNGRRCKPPSLWTPRPTPPKIDRAGEIHTGAAAPPGAPPSAPAPRRCAAECIRAIRLRKPRRRQVADSPCAPPRCPGSSPVTAIVAKSAFPLRSWPGVMPLLP